MAYDPKPRKLQTRKLLRAAVGVAAVNFVPACGASSDLETNTNLNAQVTATTLTSAKTAPSAKTVPTASVPGPGTSFVTSGNLMPPPSVTVPPKPSNTIVTSGNLMPPPSATVLLTTPIPLAPKPTSSFVTSGNLMPPPVFDAGVAFEDAGPIPVVVVSPSTSVAPSTSHTASPNSTALPNPSSSFVTSGNLMPPPTSSVQ